MFSSEGVECFVFVLFEAGEVSKFREFLFPIEAEWFAFIFSSLLVVGGWEKKEVDPMGNGSDGVDLVADLLDACSALVARLSSFEQ